MKAVSMAALSVILAAGCLPVDTRPPPGRAVVTVSGDDTSSGWTTDDGWFVRYDRQLISLGNVGIEEGPCVSYAESHYVRIIDLSQSGPQRLAEEYAIGTCPVMVEVRQPPEEVVLGANVEDEDVALLRTIGSDPYVQDRGVGLHLAGTATRGETALRFAWSIRENLIYGGCNEIAFTTDATVELDVRVVTSALFSDPVLSGGAAGSHFEPFAAADADADGEVTLDELDAVPLEAGGRNTFGAWFYEHTVPELVTIGGKRCMPGRFQED
jgi:hypothetical protein